MQREQGLYKGVHAAEKCGKLKKYHPFGAERLRPYRHRAPCRGREHSQTAAALPPRRRACACGCCPAQKKAQAWLRHRLVCWCACGPPCKSGQRHDRPGGSCGWARAGPVCRAAKAAACRGAAPGPLRQHGACAAVHKEGGLQQSISAAVCRTGRIRQERKVQNEKSGFCRLHRYAGEGGRAGDARRGAHHL